jgi:hypothetical protein
VQPTEASRLNLSPRHMPTTLFELHQGAVISAAADSWSKRSLTAQEADPGKQLRRTKQLHLVHHMDTSRWGLRPWLGHLF